MCVYYNVYVCVCVCVCVCVSCEIQRVSSRLVRPRSRVSCVVC
jgi:hypothetical protein